MTENTFNAVELQQDHELTIDALKRELNALLTQNYELRTEKEALFARLAKVKADYDAQAQAPNFFGLMQAGIEKEIQRCTQDYLMSSTFQDMVVGQVEESIADLNIRAMVDECVNDAGYQDIVQENIAAAIQDADFETLIDDALSRNGLVEAAVEAAIENTLNNVRIDFSSSGRR